jgi:hypothetical protein
VAAAAAVLGGGGEGGGAAAASAGTGTALLTPAPTATGLAVATVKLKVVAAVVALLLVAGTAAVTVWTRSNPGRVLVVASPASPGGTPAGPAPTGRGAAIVVAGIVRAPDGSPLPQAEVLVSTESAMVAAYPNRQQDAPSTRTGPDGRFSLTLYTQPLAIVVRSDVGYAQVLWEVFGPNPDVTVQAWGRIEGILRSGETALPGRTVRLIRLSEGPSDWPKWRVQHEAATRTDGLGRFQFPRVVPGGAYVRVVEGDRELRAASVEVLAGRTARADLGGRGRAVTGRLVLAGDVPSDPVGFTGSLTRIPDAPEVKRTSAPGELNVFDVWRQRRAWDRSAAGAASDDHEYTVAFDVAGEGRYRIEDVRPGTYFIQLWAKDEGKRGLRIDGIQSRLLVVPKAVAGDGSPVDAPDVTVRLTGSGKTTSRPASPNG